MSVHLIKCLKFLGKNLSKEFVESRNQKRVQVGTKETCIKTII